MKKIIILFVLTMFVLISGCSKQSGIEVKEWAQFQDQIFKVSFFYPKGWSVALEPTKVVVSSSVEVAEKFFDFDPRKPDGIQIVIASERSSMQDCEEYIKDFKGTKTTEGFTVGQIENTTIEGIPAKKITYSGVFPENVKMKAVCIAALKDSVFYNIRYAAFGDMFQPNAPIFDSVIASLRLPQKIMVEKGVDPSIPVAQTERYSDDYMQLEYPANFSANDLQKKGDVVLAVRFDKSGGRQDCTVDIDVRPAKKLSLDKVVAQNSKFFNAVSKGETKVSGEKSIYLNYVPKAKINSRVYFIVKNDKIYRIILNYYVPMKKDFLPAFEKVIASIHLK